MSIAATLDALTDAAHDFAAKVQAAKQVLAVPAGPFAVGQVIDPSRVGDLPIGAAFSDRDGDVWHVTADGLAWDAEGAELVESYDSPEDYEPLTITALPKPEVVVEEPAVTAGDRVRVVSAGVFGWEEAIDGRVGTVLKVGTSYIDVPGGVAYQVALDDGPAKGSVEEDDGIWAEKVEKLAEPASKRLDIEASGKDLRAEPSVMKDGAFIRIVGGTAAQAIHLTADQTARLAATLQAIVADA